MSFAEPSAAATEPSAGQSAVAQALIGLTNLRGRPLAEQPDVYQSIHAELQAALADIDDA